MSNLLSRKVPVKRNGKVQSLSFREALVSKLAAKAIEGNTRDLIALVKLVEQYAPAELDAVHGPTIVEIQYVLPEGKTVEDYESQENWMGRDEKRNGRTGPSGGEGDFDAAWKASGIDDADD